MTVLNKDEYLPRAPREDLVNINFLRNSLGYGLQTKKTLERAVKLGNNSKQKVVIVFQTTNGTLSTRTTIWMVGKEYVLVKGNIAIPIDSRGSIKP